MRTLVASLTLMLTLAACSTDEPLAPLAAEAAATYTLMMVDGSALPVVYREAPAWTDEIVSGTVELRADGRFTDRSLYRRTRDGATTTTTLTVTVTGRWARRDHVVTFRPAGDVGPGRLYTMRLEGTRLILVDAGLTSVFER
jgi:hypothetical protein